MNENRGLQDSELYEARFQYKERRSTIRFVGIFLFVIWTLACLIFAWHSAFGGVQVSGGSMLPGLQDGDYLIVKYFEVGDELPYGSVIVLDIEHYPEVQAYNAKKRKENPKWVDTKFIIKRLIAKAGDIVRCRDGVVQVWYSGDSGFTTLDEPYAQYYNKASYDFKQDYILKEGEIFFLGDNRDNSLDSRYNEGMSHLKYLYRESDIYGVVPTWAMENKKFLEPIFFWRELLAENRKR
ncbi:MAG: signal peptidase I [Clostridia bacterium]|nr:signal peptidase I [Clostridia bacterium]